MSDLVLHGAPHASQAIVLPEPRGGPINIRPAVLFPGGGADMMFIDRLQKQHSTMVGFMPRMQLEAYIKSGHVLIADSSPSLPGRGAGGGSSIANHDAGSVVDGPTHPPAPSLKGGGVKPLGYIIARDQYFKRDDVGIIYQLNVVPGQQRGLIGASLLKAQFERSAWGCKLYCCWCAQDLDANYFWEAMGFVPLAFRAGSEKKRRVHIFWQKRIREGDTETPWWFPSKTSSGAIREDRIVLPIPPGTHWSDGMPMVLPGEQKSEVRDQFSASDLTSDLCPLTSSGRKQRQPRAKKAKAVEKPCLIRRNGLRFEIPVQGAKPPEIKPETKPAKATRVKRACDPRHVAAARELRDRYLEQVNSDGMLPAAHGKYDVSRQLEAAPSTLKQTPLLKAA